MTDSLQIAAAIPGTRTAQAGARSATPETEARRRGEAGEGAGGPGDFDSAYSERPVRSREAQGARQGEAGAPAEQSGQPPATGDRGASRTGFMELQAQAADPEASTTLDPGAAARATQPDVEASGAQTWVREDASKVPAAALVNTPDSGDVTVPFTANAIVPASGEPGDVVTKTDPAKAAVKNSGVALAGASSQTEHGAPPRVATSSQAVPATTAPAEMLPVHVAAPPEDRGAQRGDPTGAMVSSPPRVEAASGALAGDGTGGGPGNRGAGSGSGNGTGATVADPGKVGSSAALSGSPDGELMAVAEGREASAARSVVSAAEAPRADTPRPAMAQIVDAVRLTRDGTVEVSLHPEELGRVRLSLSGGDGALQVQIQSDRPETADLLRRHIAQLQEDLRALGYRDVSFRFGADTGTGGNAAPRTTFDTDEDPQTATAIAVATPALDAALRMAGGGLDLRF